MNVWDTVPYVRITVCRWIMEKLILSFHSLVGVSLDTLPLVFDE